MKPGRGGWQQIAPPHAQTNRRQQWASISTNWPIWVLEVRCWHVKAGKGEPGLLRGLLPGSWRWEFCTNQIDLVLVQTSRCRKTSETLSTGHPGFISGNYFPNAGEWLARSSGSGVRTGRVSRAEWSQERTFNDNHLSLCYGPGESLKLQLPVETNKVMVCFPKSFQKSCNYKSPIWPDKLTVSSFMLISCFSAYILVVGWVADSNHKWMQESGWHWGAVRGGRRGKLKCFPYPVFSSF